MNLPTLTPAAWAQAVIGAVLIAFGSVLAYKTFTRASDVLDQPQKLAVWLELRKVVHVAPPQEEQSLLNFKPQVSLFRDDQLQTLGGYLCLFISAFFLLVLARISAAFLGSGTKLLTGALKSAGPDRPDPSP